MTFHDISSDFQTLINIQLTDNIENHLLTFLNFIHENGSGRSCHVECRILFGESGSNDRHEMVSTITILKQFVNAFTVW